MSILVQICAGFGLRYSSLWTLILGLFGQKMQQVVQAVFDSFMGSFGLGDISLNLSLFLFLFQCWCKATLLLFQDFWKVCMISGKWWCACLLSKLAIFFEWNTADYFAVAGQFLPLGCVLLVFICCLLFALRYRLDLLFISYILLFVWSTAIFAACFGQPFFSSFTWQLWLVDASLLLCSLGLAAIFYLFAHFFVACCYVLMLFYYTVCFMLQD